jgi:hypothetical protein
MIRRLDLINIADDRDPFSIRREVREPVVVLVVHH